MGYELIQYIVSVASPGQCKHEFPYVTSRKISAMRVYRDAIRGGATQIRVERRVKRATGQELINTVAEHQP